MHTYKILGLTIVSSDLNLKTFDILRVNFRFALVS